MNIKNKIGKFGQQIAGQILEKKGYKILTENFYTRGGEIDLIAEQGSQIVFVEVKTRLSNRFGLPEEAVDSAKKEKFYEAALKYLEEKQIEHDNFRLDLIAVEINKENKTAKIRHHKNIV